MIKRGQIYRAIKPSESMPGAHHRRIKVVGEPMTTPGVYGFGTVMIATLMENGREVNSRSIKMDQLHSSSTTNMGKQRKNGYLLVKE